MSWCRLFFTMPHDPTFWPVEDLAQRWPDWFTPNLHAKAHAQNVMRGLHPLGFQLNADPELRCRGCAFVRPLTLGRTYLKCTKTKLTHGPGTDVRLRWRACVLYEARPSP